MLAVKGRFDGKRVVLPKTLGLPKCSVIVVFEDDISTSEAERGAWLRVQEASLNKVWDNEDDAAYDRL